MKKPQIFLVFILLATMVFGCKKNSGDTTDLSGKYVLTYQTAKPIPNPTSSTSMTLTEVKDDRCPINANCVSYGSATARIIFLDGKTQRTLDLCIGTCTTKAKLIEAAGAKYTVEMTELLPYPGTTTLPPYLPAATIKIAKLN